MRNEFIEGPDDPGVLLDGHRHNGGEDGEKGRSYSDSGAVCTLGNMEDDIHHTIIKVDSLVSCLISPAVFFYDIK